jgi:hypothetical protein
VSTTEAFQRVAVPALHVELPIASATANNLDSGVREECRKVDQDAAMGEGTRSLELSVARSLAAAVAVTCKVHQLWEILLTASWVPAYSENPITQ